MLIAALVIVSLLGLGALLFALRRLKAGEARRARAEAELAEALKRLEEERRERALADAEAAGRLEALRAEAAEARAALSRAESAPTDTKPDEGEAAGAAEVSDAQALAWSMDAFFQQTTHPRQLLGHETFERGVEVLCSDSYRPHELLAKGLGESVVLACMAFEAMARRADARGSAERIIERLNDIYYWPRFFAMRALEAYARRPVAAEVLARVNSSWQDSVPSEVLAEFLERRRQAGDPVTFEALARQLERQHVTPYQAGELRVILGQLDHVVPREVVEQFEAWQDEAGLAESLKTIGRVWEREGGPKGSGEVFVLDSVAERVSEIESALKRDPARSVILVGDPGVGKTAVVRALADRLGRERWVVFESSAAEVLAGQQYIGQLEERVQTIVRTAGGRRALWFVPNFQETLWAGQHKFSPVGVLDLLMPSIESGLLKIVGEVPSAAYEQLMRLRPKLRTVMQTCRVQPLGDEETLELGRRWAELHGTTRHAWAGMHEGVDTSYVAPRASRQTLREALQLAKQYLGDKAAPGNLMGLLDATHRRLLAEDGESKAREITPDDLLVTLSQMTGLPLQILDEREGLDLARLRAFFESRVLGQPEAVECLVERVALVKAGLTDPTRPQGVFLFVGPTGTGKTEIAKTLAEFLFGSPDRMIRLDMSEFMAPESLDRILGESHATSDTPALVNQIRKQPFSVVLLDEFEKAHPQVWDLFLQVFDDGRLTDRRGNTADFRHSVIIMTSNLGATLPAGAGIGFSQEQAQFAAGAVERAVGRAFRR
ncbi:MAG TPA: AAA family ATPase, partial [Pyrinomonadaceae bacterium]|nr:AAA family ATPase [Pyrinomonadaceae bacterium]